MATAAAARLPQMRPQEISNTARACGSMQWRGDPLLSAFQVLAVEGGAPHRW